MVGDEGMLGVPLLLGIDVSPLQSKVQAAGEALRIERRLFEKHLAQSPTLLRVLKRNVHVRLEQLARTGACSRFHVIEERLARRLLMSQDRVHADDFHVTQEALAADLGVRRAGITAAAAALQRRALIRYRRGGMTIVDRLGLELRACSCYAADNAIYKLAMG